MILKFLKIHIGIGRRHSQKWFSRNICRTLVFEKLNHKKCFTKFSFFFLICGHFHYIIYKKSKIFVRDTMGISFWAFWAPWKHHINKYCFCLDRPGIFFCISVFSRVPWIYVCVFNYFCYFLKAKKQSRITPTLPFWNQIS